MVGGEDPATARDGAGGREGARPPGAEGSDARRGPRAASGRDRDGAQRRAQRARARRGAGRRAGGDRGRVLERSRASPRSPSPTGSRPIRRHSGSRWPTSSNPRHAQAAAPVAAAAVAALGIEVGPSYTQLRLGPDGPQVIEVAARLGGGHDAELVQAATGVDLNGLALAAALGSELVLTERRSRRGGAVTRFLVAPAGRPRACRGPGRARGRRIRADLPRAGLRVRAAAPRLPTAPGPCSCSARIASRPWRGRRPRHNAYASSPRMPELSSKRTEFLSFQPPAISEEEIAAVSETLRSGWLTTGPRTAELEARMRDYLEAKHVLAVSSCTAALHLSLVALGVGPGDEVITTSLTWPATANVIVHCGATPVFADVRDGHAEHRPRAGRGRSSASGRRRSSRSTSTASPPTSTRSRRSACRSSRTRRTPPSRATAAARSARSPT